LDNFILPESRYPVLVTTSRLLTTGVDAQTCKLIVLDRRVQSMTEFKQIIGRGTRINEEWGKFFFTVMDFKQATDRFADPDFDGEPVQIYQPGEDDPVVPPEEGDNVITGGDDVPGATDVPDVTWDPDGRVRPRKYFVGDVEVRVVSERVQYYGSDGKLITESLRDYTRKAAQREFGSLDGFLRHWNQSGQKGALLSELEEHGLLLDALAEDVGRDYDPFDLVCHVAFDRPPLTRRERADNVKKRDIFTRHSEAARKVLSALLDKYADEGIEPIENIGVLRLLNLGTPVEVVKTFGGRDGYLKALQELESEIYGGDDGPWHRAA
jgi:type I restriction enzyme R subunit